MHALFSPLSGVRIHQEASLYAIVSSVDAHAAADEAPRAIASMRTLRFVLIARAGRLTRIGGRNVLRLTQNPAIEQLYAKVSHALIA